MLQGYSLSATVPKDHKTHRRRRECKCCGALCEYICKKNQILLLIKYVLVDICVSVATRHSRHAIARHAIARHAIATPRGKAPHGILLLSNNFISLGPFLLSRRAHLAPLCPLGWRRDGTGPHLILVWTEGRQIASHQPHRGDPGHSWAAGVSRVPVSPLSTCKATIGPPTTHLRHPSNILLH